MNQLVEECRREWRRLGVPDAVADAAILLATLSWWWWSGRDRWSRRGSHVY